MYCCDHTDSSWYQAHPFCQARVYICNILWKLWNNKYRFAEIVSLSIYFITIKYVIIWNMITIKRNYTAYYLKCGTSFTSPPVYRHWSDQLRYWFSEISHPTYWQYCVWLINLRYCCAVCDNRKCISSVWNRWYVKRISNVNII